jgi:hypothetical protein
VLLAADWLLTVVHVGVVLGFVLLWIPRPAARFHRWLVLAVACSWFGIGVFKGLGYCFLTDLHWYVKRARGVEDLPGSFLKYAGDWITGTDLSAPVVDTIAAIAFVGGGAAALLTYLRDRTGTRA